MRALHLLPAIVTAAILSVACDSTTGPEITPPDTGPTVLTVAPSFAMIDGQRVIKLTAILPGLGASQAQVIWTSSDPNVATVRAGGLVEGHKDGRVQITADYQAAHGSATVLVLNQRQPKPTDPPACMKRPAPKGRYLSVPTPC